MNTELRNHRWSCFCNGRNLQQINHQLSIGKLLSDDNDDDDDLSYTSARTCEVNTYSMWLRGWQTKRESRNDYEMIGFTLLVMETNVWHNPHSVPGAVLSSFCSSTFRGKRQQNAGLSARQCYKRLSQNHRALCFVKHRGKFCLSRASEIQFLFS